ncbi:hypothetical protein B0H14DRAFT_2794427 [Mycena olivaceomarginata]|nr:hypothetical protein B0H14DRAFT_2794427 [Mycena olivaceomarginata]
MSRQDKATTDRFTRTLRELVKRPDNKLCADCKRNDPRWASWNLGVFLCIRCSGIHRGMGTHISKVKSVDLDVWTPEQMQSIQKWGNRLANLYWEAHLKAGHQPPEHKMESFIRSKYESRRWALDGPPPPDPSVLDSEAGASEEPGADTAPAPVAVAATPDPIGWGAPSPPRASNSTVNRQPQPRQLISAGHATNSRTSVPLVRPPPGPASTRCTRAGPTSTRTPRRPLLARLPRPCCPGFAPRRPEERKAGYPFPFLYTCRRARTRVRTVPAAAVEPVGLHRSKQQSNLWGAPAPQQQQPQFGAVADTNNVWGGMVSAGSGGEYGFQQKKDDAFGDLWGGFK